MLSPTLDSVTKLDFRPEPITPLIYKLNDQQISSQNENKNNSNNSMTYLQIIPNSNNTKHIYKILKHPFIYCFITPNSIIGSKTEYKFKFNLYINNPDEQNQDQSVYKYIFTATFRDIKSVYSKAIGKRKHFPVQKLPTC